MGNSNDGRVDLIQVNGDGKIRRIKNLRSYCEREGVSYFEEGVLPFEALKEGNLEGYIGVYSSIVSIISRKYEKDEGMDDMGDLLKKVGLNQDMISSLEARILFLLDSMRRGRIMGVDILENKFFGDADSMDEITNGMALKFVCAERIKKRSNYVDDENLSENEARIQEKWIRKMMRVRSGRMIRETAYDDGVNLTGDEMLRDCGVYDERVD